MPLTIRVIPEVLMGAWPVGFDVITYYIPYMYNVKRYGFWVPLLKIIQDQTAPLTYVMLSLVAYVPLNHVLIAKIISPLIYGFLGLAVYLFVGKLFEWEPPKAFFATAITTTYFVSLRFSWDMWKNTLSLVFFLLAAFYLKREEYEKFTVSSLLCVLTHELMSILLGSALMIVLLKEVTRRSGRPFNRTRLLMLTLLACSAFVGAGYYTRCIKVLPPYQPNIPSELLFSGKPLTIPYNYLSGGDWYNYLSEDDVRIEASMLMIKMYGPVLPLAILGLRRDDWMNSYTAVSTLPFISVIVAPSVAIPAWHRFAFLLTIPLTIYAANFLVKKKKSKQIYLAFLVVLALGYAVLPPESASPYYTLFPPTYHYMPTSMLQNSVTMEDSANVEGAIGWLVSNAKEQSCLLVHEAYQGWAMILVSKEDIIIVPYNLSLATPAAAKKLYSHVYLIWWIKNMSWYDWSPPTQFMQIKQMGRIAIYEYVNDSSI